MTTNFFMDKCTRHFRSVLVQAFNHATLQGTKVVTPLHLLFSLACESGSIGQEILTRSGLKRDALINLIAESEIITLHNTALLSPATKRAIERGVIRAAREGHTYIGTEHLLWGLLEIESADVDLVLQSSSVKRKDLEQQLEVALKSAAKLPEILHSMWGDASARTTDGKTKINSPEKTSKQKNQALEYFGVELTDTKYSQRIDPVIGRDSEIERVIHILARRTKNNPLLLGDPGVGKTAIVEGLAKRIVAGAVPPTLLGKRIFAIDLGLMVAGTMYRGEFESRVKQLVDEVRENPDIILFIDEVHSIVGAGASSGTLDAANLLKPALARGELHVIGATTHEEFKKNIEHDAALERRFQPVQVREPSAEETVQMLRHVKERYEKFHGITISDEALETAVKLSGKYFPEKRFPDKALDLVDEAMSAVKVQTAHVGRAVHRDELKRELVLLMQNKEAAILKENFEAAQKIKTREQEIYLELTTIDTQESEAPPRAQVKIADVNAVVSRMLRRTINEQSDTPPTATLGEFLRGKIFGQDEIIKTITTTIARSQLGLHGDSRPLASFLFVGSSGVGKTELAKLIAEGVYADPKSLIRLDMTEFSEGFSVSKMLGAPAGYVGYRESNTLVDRLRRQPMSVLLFDEIDKAHPDVLNILLQMLEEGRLTDASGKEASVKQAIIVLTYQVPLEEISGSQFGFAPAARAAIRAPEHIRTSLFSVIRPELLNRIDHVCVFNPMNTAELTRIATFQLEDLRTRLARRNVSLTWPTAVPDFIAAQAHEPKEGARRVRHIMEDKIEKPLITDFAANTERAGYELVLKNDILSVEPLLYGTAEHAISKIGKRISKKLARIAHV